MCLFVNRCCSCQVLSEEEMVFLPYEPAKKTQIALSARNTTQPGSQVGALWEGKERCKREFYANEK